jgi:hypothetical protein
MLNIPIDREEFPTATYYVHGTRFRDMLNVESLEKRGFIMEPPLYKNLPPDALVRHTRN